MSSLMDDRDDSMRLPPRERRTVRDDPPSYDEKESDREFTLSTGTVLGIFFALALVCAVFFGFGYSMGRKSGQATAEATAAAAPSAEAAADVAASKPSPGAPAIQAIPGYMSQSQADAANRTPAPQAYKSAPVARSPDPALVVVPTTTPINSKPSRPTSPAAVPAVALPAAPIERRPDTRAAAVPTSTLTAAIAGSGSSFVQIAAVSHQEDADVLLSALRRRGYSVFARPGETDRLIHVQVGPFATRKDADAMRQRLLGDGYNAIVKQ